MELWVLCPLNVGLQLASERLRREGLMLSVTLVGWV